MIPKKAQANKEIIEIISEEWALSERDLELVKYTIKKALSLADTPRGTGKKHSYVPEMRYVLNHPTVKGMECAYDEQISTLSKKVQELQTELEKWKKQTKAHEEFIGKLLRQINCVKDHPRIKPLNCCWMADSMELKIRRKDVESRPK